MTNRKLKDEFVSDNLFNKTTDTLEDITASDNFEKISTADSSTNESHVLIKSPDGLANLLTVTPTVTQVAAPSLPKIIEVDLSSRVDNLETGDVFIVMLQLQVSGPVNSISYVADAADTLTDIYTGLITDATNKGYTARYSFGTSGTALEVTGLFNFDNYDVEDARVERNVDHYWGFQPFFPAGDILVADCDFYSGAVTEQVTGGTNFDVIIDWPFDPNRTPNQFLGHSFRVIIDGTGVASYDVVVGDIADTLEETLDNIRTQVKGQVDASSGGITDFDSCFLDTTTAHNRLVVRRTNTTAWSNNSASRTWDESPKGLSFALKSLGLEDPTDPTQGLIDATDGLSVGDFTASDTHQASTSADKAFDNDASTWWRPGTDLDAVAAEWLKVDFGAGNEKVIERMTLQPRFVGGQATVKDFLIQGSNVASPNTGRDHADWTTLGTFTHGNNGNIEQFFFLENTTAYRHYRIYVDNTYYEYLSIIVVEVQLFEPTASSTASAATASGVVQDTSYENYSLVTPTASQTIYSSQNGGWSGSEGDGSFFVAPFDGQMKAIVISEGAQPTNSVVTFTPRINSVDSSNTLTFTDADDGQFVRETVPVEVSQGDLISLKAVESGAVGATTFHSSIAFERSDSRNSNIASESYIRVTPGASDSIYGSQTGAWSGTLGSGSGFLAPFDGDMKIIAVSSAAIGASSVVTFTPLVNLSTQANTLQFDGTDTEATVKVSSTVGVSQGDLIQLNLTESGAASPSATFYVCVVCEASSALEIDSVAESMVSESPTADETLFSSQIGGWSGSASEYEVAPFSGSLRILVRNSNAIGASAVVNFTPLINDADQTNTVFFDQTDSSAVAKLSDKVRVQKGDLVNIRLDEVGSSNPGASFNCSVIFERNLNPVSYFEDLEDAQFSLPDGTGTNGQVLTSDGAGGSSWTNSSGGSSGGSSAIEEIDDDYTVTASNSTILIDAVDRKPGDLTKLVTVNDINASNNTSIVMQAIDKDDGTAWGPTTAGEHFIRIDFGSGNEQKFKQIALIGDKVGDIGRIGSFSVKGINVSDPLSEPNGGTWTTLYSDTYDNSGPDGLQAKQFFDLGNNTAYRGFLIEVGSTSPQTAATAIQELEIYSGPIVVDLPDPATVFSGGEGQKFQFKKIDSSEGQAVLLPASGNIDGDASLYLNTENKAVTIQSDGTNYFVVSDYRGGSSNTKPVTSKTANYTATTSDCVILVNASAGAVTITLPTAASAFNSGEGNHFIVKKTDSTPYPVNIVVTSSGTMDGQTTLSITEQYDTEEVISNGTEYSRV